MTPRDGDVPEGRRAAKRPAVTRKSRGGARAGRSDRTRPATESARRASASAPSSQGGSGPRTSSGPAARTKRRARLRIATGPFRLWSAFCVVAFVLSLFAARLVQLQGIDANDYAALAVKMSKHRAALYAPRASIFDRNGTVLARSVMAEKLVADPTYTSAHATAIATFLHDRFKVDYIQALTALERPNTRYAVVARQLDPDVADKAVRQVAKRGWPGLYVAHDTTRVYPDGDVAANLVGVVGAEDSGLAGFEHSLNSLLRGKNGWETYQMSDGVQLPLANDKIVAPKEGTGVRLTIDQDLQYQAQIRLDEAVHDAGAHSGVAIVEDVKTGQILALADDPTFDPNSYMATSPRNYGSRAIQDVYDPGSVEKVLTFASLIDAGYVTPTTRLEVPGQIMRDGKTINDDVPHGLEKLTAAGVLAKSSNIGTVLASSKMPKATLYSYLQSFGLGKRTGVGYPGESGGLLPALSSWIPLTKATIAFGQGLSVTALQMAAAVSAVANHGIYVQPSLIDGYVSSDGTFTPATAPKTHRVVSAYTAHEVTRMMEDVVGPEGTAPGAAITGYQVAGKTGTAQKVNVKCGCYGHGTTTSFVGFAPADNPRFLVYVVLQHPRSGSTGSGTAAPVFKDLMSTTLQKYGVPPSGRQEPALPVTWGHG